METSFGKRGCSHAPYVARDGKIYLVDDDNVVLCFDKKGKQEWKKTVKDALSQDPFMDDNGILFLYGVSDKSDKKLIIKLDTRKKRKYGKHSSLSNILDSKNSGSKVEITGQESTDLLHHLILDSNGNVYGFREGKFRATNLDGKEIWAIDLPGETLSTWPQFGEDGRLYVNVRNHSLLALDPATGKEFWRMEKDQDKEPISNNMTWRKDGVTYITGEGANWKLYVINPDGSEKWVHNEPEHISRPKIGKDGVIFTGNEMGK